MAADTITRVSGLYVHFEANKPDIVKVFRTVNIKETKDEAEAQPVAIFKRNVLGYWRGTYPKNTEDRLRRTLRRVRIWLKKENLKAGIVTLPRV